MFVVNCAADYVAVGALHADTTARLRKGHIDLDLGPLTSLTGLTELQGGYQGGYRGGILQQGGRGWRRRSLEVQPGMRLGWDLQAAMPPRQSSEGVKG